MNWWTIVKQGKILTLPKPQLRIKKPVKEETDKECINWLKGLYNIFDKYKDLDYGHPYALGDAPNTFNIDNEKLACTIKDYLITVHPDLGLSTNDEPMKYDGKDLWYSDGIYISFYYTDYFESVVNIDYEDTHINMSIAAGWENITSVIDEESKDMMKPSDDLYKYIERYNDAHLEIFKYINQQKQFDYFRQYIINEFVWALTRQPYGSSTNIELREYFERKLSNW